MTTIGNPSRNANEKTTGIANGNLASGTSSNPTEKVSTFGTPSRKTTMDPSEKATGIPSRKMASGSPSGKTSRTSIGNRSKSASFNQRAPLAASSYRKRDNMISAIRNNYKTSVYNLTIDQYTLVLFQNHQSPISRFFLFYKYCHALMILGTFGFTLYHLPAYANEAGLKWHIFLDHWMAVVGTVEALCGVFAVTYFYHHCRTKAMRDSYHISEGLSVRLLIYAIINSTAITFIFAGTVIFWFFIGGMQEKNPVSIEHVIVLDALLPALLFVKMNVENVPFTIDRFLYPIALMLIYFINVIVHYYLHYVASFNAGGPKYYIFIYFNDTSLLHFLWFMLESLLITLAVHIFATLVWHSRRLFVRLCCPHRDHRLPRAAAASPDDGRSRSYVFREDFVEAVPDPRKSACKRRFQKIADLERLYRHDFIQPEWKQRLNERPSFMYVLYRTGHMILHFLMVFISLFEPEKPLKNRAVKTFILWAFNFGNFFLLVSFLQSLAGFCVILYAYARKSSLKYYEKSELHVTGFQRFYAAINGCALALAVFTFATSWLLIDDAKKEFSSHDYTYDVPHAGNPLSMSIDFFIVAHPYKFKYCILSFGILAMNIVFNYWLFHSKITGRTGSKFIYDYLKWDETLNVTVHIAVLYSILTAVHLTVWMIFLAKRAINVAFHRRHLYRHREPIFRHDSAANIFESDGTTKAPLASGFNPTKSTVAIKAENLELFKSNISSGPSTVTTSSSTKTIRSVKSLK